MPELQFQIIDLKIMKADFTLIEERKIRREKFVSSLSDDHKKLKKLSTKTL